MMEIADAVSNTIPIHILEFLFGASLGIFTFTCGILYERLRRNHWYSHNGEYTFGYPTKDNGAYTLSSTTPTKKTQP